MDKEGVILANPEGRAWDFAREIFEKLRDMKPPLTWGFGELKVKEFRDGEIKVKAVENVRKKEVYFIHDSSLAPNNWMVQLAFVNEMLANSSAQEICDVLPYMRYARQDRKDESRVAVNMKSVAEIVNLHAHRVLTCDIHNPATLHFFNIPADNLYSSYSFVPYLAGFEKSFLENCVLVGPDIGSIGRTKGFAKRLGGLDIAMTYKRKKMKKLEEKTGEESASQEIDEMVLLGDVEKKNCLIVDDMFDSGGTARKCADLLRQRGAREVRGCFTHAVMSGEAVENIKYLEGVYFGDSVSLKEKPGNVVVVSLVDLFADAIYRTRKGDSLSDLFK